MPAALAFLLLLANDRELMGPQVNPRLLNFAGVAIAFLVGLAGTSYAVVAFVNTVTEHASGGTGISPASTSTPANRRSTGRNRGTVPRCQARWTCRRRGASP